jgi:hypothetical protein
MTRSITEWIEIDLIDADMKLYVYDEAATFEATRTNGEWMVSLHEIRVGEKVVTIGTSLAKGFLEMIGEEGKAQIAKRCARIEDQLEIEDRDAAIEMRVDYARENNS